MTLRDKLSTSLEQRVVLAAAVPYPDDEARRRLRDVAGEGPAWDRVMAVAEQAKVLPLAARNLEAAAGDLLPEAVRGRLRARAEVHARRNLVRMAELVRLVRVFSAHGIDALPFKGPVMAQTLYGNLALRQFSDLDLLVPEASFAQAVSLLRQEGYVQQRPARVLEPAEVEAVVRFVDEYHFQFKNPERKTALELHWRFLRRTPVEMFLSPAPVEVEVGGQRMQTLAPEALIRYLCLHGSKDGWRRLSWVCDVAAFVHVHASLDWDAVWAQARRDGAATRLCLGMYLAHHLLRSPLPEAIRPHVASRRRQVERLAVRCLLLEPEGSPPLAVWLRYQCGIRERLYHKVDFLRVFAFVPKHWSIDGAMLQSRTPAAYVVRRLRRLVTSHVPRLLR